MSDKIVFKMPRSSIEAMIEFSERELRSLEKYAIESLAKILSDSKSDENPDFGEPGDLMIIPRSQCIEFRNQMGKITPYFYDVGNRNSFHVIELKKIKACSDCKSETCDDCGEPLPKAMLSFAKMTPNQRSR